MANPVVDLNGAVAGNDNTASFTEQTPVLIAPAATITDADSPNLTSLTVTLTARPDGDAVESLSLNATASALAFTDLLTVTYTAATGVLLVTGSASPAEYQSILEGVVYNNTSDTPTTTNRTVSVVAVDDTAGSSTLQNVTIGITAVNDAPVVDLNGAVAGNDATASFTEQTPLVIVPAATITDVDSATLASLTATLTTRPDGDGVESLSLNATAAALATTDSLTVTYTAATGVLSITGSASTADYQSILEGVVYNNTSDTPTTTSRNVDVVANDGTDPSVTHSVTISVAAVNDPPVVDLNGAVAGNDATASFTEQTPLVIVPAATITDVDSATLASLTATLTTRPDGDGVESLSLNATAAALATTDGLAVTYTAATGVLSVTGSASKADYQSILEGVVYNNTSDTPTTTNRNVDVVANDGTDPSVTHSVTISVTAVNDPPVVDLNGAVAGNDATASFTEQTPLVIAPAATIADVDSASLASLTATLTTRPDGNAVESLSLNATAAALATTDSLTVTYTAATGVLSITGSASTADYQSILEGVVYNNTSDTPTTTSRTVNVVANDGTDPSVTHSVTISVAAVNDPPVTDLNGAGAGNNATASFTEQTPLVIAPAATITDVDSATLASLTATLTTRPDGNAVESLSLNATAAALATTDSLTVSYTAASGVLSVTGSASKADYQTILDGIVYNNTSDTPTTTNRNVDVVVNDGTDPSGTHSVTISVAAVNDPPVVDLNGAGAGNNATASFTEQTPLVIAPAATIIDVDSASLASLTATLTTRPDGNAVESLSLNAAAAAIVTTDGLTVTYTATTGVLSITGSASTADYQSILEGVRYNNTSDNPTTTNRNVDVVANDGTDPSVTHSVTISVTTVNDEPTLTATASNPTFTEAAGLGTQAAPVAVFSAANASTIEAGQTITGLTFTVGGLHDGANEKLLVDGTAITLGANSSGTTSTNSMGYSVAIAGGIATIALTKPAGVSTANIDTLINAITYQDTSTDAPTAGDRTFTLTQIQDSGGVANGGDDTKALSIPSTVHVVAVNDGPTNTVPGAQIATENTDKAIAGISVADPDAAPQNVQVTLHVDHGTLDVKNGVAGGLDDAHISGDTTGNVVLTGTTAQIDATLGASNGLIYHGNINYTGGDTLTVQTSDLGHTGGGALTDSDPVAITVNAAVASNTLSATQTTTLATDNDGDGVIDPLDHVTVTVTIANNSTTTAATGVSFNETLSGLTQNGAVHVTPIAFDDSYTGVSGNTPIHLSVLANDIDPNSSTPLSNVGLTITGVDTTGTAGTVSIDAGNTTVTFTPTTGFSGLTTFKYFTTDAEGLQSNEAATVTVNVNGGNIWYVDANASSVGQDGSFNHAFTSLTQLNGVTGDGTTNDDVDGAGDTIFVYSDTASPITYTGGIVLEANQKLIGDGVAFSANGLTIGHATDDAAHAPTIANAAAAGHDVTLSTGNTLSGINLGNTGAGGSALFGSGFGTLTVDHTAINTNNTAIDLTNGAFGAGAAFSTVSVSNTGVTDVNLNNVSGTADLGSGTMNGQFAVTGGSVSTTYAGNITQSGNAALVNVSGGHTGTLTFNTGTLTATNGTGLQFDNADGNYNFNGTNTLSNAVGGATANAGINIVNGSGGNFSFSSNSSIVNQNTGTAFNVSGGGGNITYAGTIGTTTAGTDNHGSTSVSIVNHTGGTVALSGNILDSNDTGGGIGISGNTNTTINFSGAAKTLDTGIGDAVSMTSNTGSTVNFTNGGLTIQTTNGTGFTDTGAGTVSVTGSGNTINATGTGAAVNLNSVAIGASGLTFDSTSAAGSTNGVKIASASGGAISLGSGSLSGASGAEFLIGDGAGTANTGGTAAITYGGSITTTGAARAVDIEDRAVGAANVTLSGTVSHASGDGSTFFLDQNAAGTIAFSGANSVANSGTADAIHLTSNTGATINFTGGGLNIDTTSGTGVLATGGGTVNVTGTNNSINSVSQTALNVANTTIGSSGLTFHDVSSGNNTAAADPVNGIVLNTTGASGHLTVTGSGSATLGGDSSGGIIQGTSGAGILLANTLSPSFTNVSIHDIGKDGIDGTAVTNFTFANGQITNTGTAAAGQYDENGIAFVDKAGPFTDTTVSGNVAITGNLISGARQNGVDIETWNGTISNLNISNNNLMGGTNTSALHNSTIATTSSIEDGIHVFAQGSATTTANITTGTINNNTISGFEFLSGAVNIGGNGIRLAGGNTAASTSSTIGTAFTNPITISGNTISNTGSNGIATSFSGQNGTSGVAVTNNTISHTEGLGISEFFGGNGTFSGLVNNNTVNGTAETVKANVAGIAVQSDNGTSTSDVTNSSFTISNNTVSNEDGDGIAAYALNNAGTMNVRIFNNAVNSIPVEAATFGIRVSENSAGPTINLEIHGNTTAGGHPVFGSPFGIGLRQNDGSVFGIEGLSPTPATNAQAVTYVNGQNPAGNGTLIIHGSGGTGNFTAVNVPDQPLFAAPGGVDAAAPSDAPQWHLAGAGDFNGDGSVDLLSIRDDGLLRADTTDSAGNLTNWYILGQLQPGWSIVGIGDINGDGTSDILLRSDDGSYQADLIQDHAIAASVDLELVNGTLQVVPPPAPPADPGPANPPSNSTPADVTPPAPVQPASGSVETHLTQAELDGIVQSAIARWEATGLTAAQDAYLHSVSFSVSDMAGLYLGSALPGHITIDADAAGYGWYIDANPADDAEFANVLSATRLQTDPSGIPAGHIDLLSTVMHELGHELGLQDSYDISNRDDLMFGYLVTGERRLPGEHEADGATPGSIDHEEFAVGPVSIGTLPVDRTVTITFDATVNAQTNQIIVNPTNQGAVTSSFPSINTNTNITTLDSLTLGDTVFNDVNGNGVFEPGSGEAGIDGVALTLFADTNSSGSLDAGDTQLATTTTAGGGLYSFIDLAPGEYIVRVDQSNFNAGGALVAFPNSSPGNPDPDNNNDNDDNGGVISGNGVASLAITLAYNTETTPGTGNDTNNTLDFGFFNVPPNAAPVITAGNTVGYTEQQSVPLAVPVDAAITVTDDGGTLDSASVTISTGLFAGDLLSFDTTFASAHGITGGFAGGVLTLNGTASTANYQTVLQSVAYRSTSDNPDNFGTDTSRIVTWTANDGTQDNSVTATTTINITAVNDAPSLANVAATQLYTTGAPFVTLSSAATVSDPDDTNLESAAVTVTDFVAGDQLSVNGVLNGGPVNGISWTYDGAGHLAFTGHSLLANYQSLLDQVQYQSTSGDPTSSGADTQRTVQWTVNDGALNSTAATTTVAIDAPPVLDLDTGDGTPPNGFTTTFTEDDSSNGHTIGSGSVLITGFAGASITDTDVGDNIVRATIDLTNPKTGDLLSYLGSVPGITLDPSSTATHIVLIGSGSHDDYVNAIETVTFENDSQNPDTTDRIINVTVNDGDTDSNVAVATIQVVSVNDAPVNSVPSAQSTNEDTNLVFTGATAISISDVDGGTTSGVDDETVTLSVAHGTLTFSGVGVLTSSTNGAASITLTGSTAGINGALSTLTYAPTANYNGPDTLTVTTNDNGHTGTDPDLLDPVDPNTTSEQAVNTVAITVNAVNDAPINSVPLVAQSVNEDTSLVFNTAHSNLISVSDIDAGTDNIRVTLLAAHGSLTLSTIAGLSFSAGDGTSDATMTFDGTVAAVNTALNGLTYLGQPNFNGGDTLTIITNDLGHNPSGPLSDTDIVTINVAAVNDTPVNTVPAVAQSVNEDTNLVFNAANGNAISVTDVDANPNDIRITLTVTNGTLTLSTIAGLSFSVGDGTTDTTMTFDGTVAEVNAALDGLIYHGNLNYFGGDTLSLTTNDLGHNGLDPGLTGGPTNEQDSDNVTINVVSVNDAPVFAGLDNTPSFVENGASVVLDNNVTISDVELDAAGNYGGASLTLVRHTGPNADDTFGATGTLDFADSNGLGENVSLDGGGTFIGTFSQPGDGTFTITFNANATAANVNSVLQQLTYFNAGDNPPTSLTIDYTFSDGNGVPGGQAQGSGPTPGIGTGSITVAPITQIDDAPGLFNVAPAASYSLGSSGVVLSLGLQVFDPDATPPSPLTGLANATIKFDSAFLATDQLFVNLATSGGHFVTPDSEVTNISVLSNAGGTMVLSGNDTVAHYQSVLDAVSYRSTAADPTNGGVNPTRTISWQVNDGALNSQTPNPDPNNLVNETILHFNAPPTLDLDASGAGTGFTTTFTEREAPIAITDTDVLITDPDNAALSSANIVLTNAKANDVMSIAGTLPGGIDSSIDTSVPGQITVHLFNSASLADYQTALEQIRFANTSVVPNTTDRDITVTVNDGDADSNVAHATVHVINLPSGGTDFNADGSSDFLWQTDGGSLAIWEMNGFQIGAADYTRLGSSQVGLPGPDWHIVDTADFNGDGKTDILWRTDSGAVAIWEMDGTHIQTADFTRLGSTAVGAPGPDWHQLGAADFDGDGKADILWRTDSGALAIWEMDGTHIKSADFIRNGSTAVGAPAPDWKIVGVGDFDGDGNNDLLWETGSGQLAVWEMNGTHIKSADYIKNGPTPTGIPGADWHVADVGDFDGDGKADILWRIGPATPVNGPQGGMSPGGGQTAIWEMNGNQIKAADYTRLGSTAVGAPGTDWHLLGSDDYNGDGMNDILWRTDAGQIAIWDMNGTHITAADYTKLGSVNTGAPGPDWHLFQHHYELI